MLREHDVQGTDMKQHSTIRCNQLHNYWTVILVRVIKDSLNNFVTTDCTWGMVGAGLSSQEFFKLE